MFVTVPISECTISCKNDIPFDIFVDGKVIRNLKKIKIKPVTINEKKEFMFDLPVMTFLPIKV